MEAVHELEAQRDQQGQAEQGEDADLQRFARALHVLHDAERDEGQAAEQDEQEGDEPRRVSLAIQGRSDAGAFLRCDGGIRHSMSPRPERGGCGDFV